MNKFERVFHDLSALPVVPPSEAAVLRRGKLRRRRAGIGTGLAVIAVLAAGTTTGVAIQRQADPAREPSLGTASPGVSPDPTPSPSPSPRATPSIKPTTVRPPASTGTYPASFLAVRDGANPLGGGRIARYDSDSGSFQRYLTGADTRFPTVADGNLYYTKGPDCATLWKQRLAGGAATQVPTGRDVGVAELASDGRQRLVWADCFTGEPLHGPVGPGSVVHVEDLGSGRSDTFELDIPDFRLSNLAPGADGRVAVFGSMVGSGEYVSVAYLVDPARTSRLSGGQLIASPAGCDLQDARWKGADLVAGLSCKVGESSNGSPQYRSRLVAISGQTLKVTSTIADLGAGSVSDLAVARDGDALVVMGTTERRGPILRVVDGVVTALSDVRPCPYPCTTGFTMPVWLE